MIYRGLETQLVLLRLRIAGSSMFFSVMGRLLGVVMNPHLVLHYNTMQNVTILWLTPNPHLNLSHECVYGNLGANAAPILRTVFFPICIFVKYNAVKFIPKDSGQ